jgi:hypothetical protein
MTLHECLAWVSAVLVIVGCTWYSLLALLGKTKPVFAGWVVLSSMSLLSYVTYWSTPQPSLASNASNAAHVIGGILAVFATATIDRRGSLRLTPFQKLSLWITAVIFIFWLILVLGFERRGDIPFWMTQAVMLLGHSMTAQKLWRGKSNTEAVFTWWCLLAASIVAIYAATDVFAVIYATRGTLTSAILVWLIHRIRRKNHNVPLGSFG